MGHLFRTEVVKKMTTSIELSVPKETSTMTYRLCAAPGCAAIRLAVAEIAAPQRIDRWKRDLIQMHTAYVVITLTTAIVTGGIAVADFIPAGFVLANSAEVGVPRSWLRPLGAAKLAGVVGLVVGLLGLPALGIAAAVGLVLFFVGAVATHLKAHVLYNIAFPGVFLCPSAASLALMVAR
jgi:hypothetical protein